MMKKQISKISMLASLLVATMVNAQEFYTCVPKKSWWGDVIRENTSNSLQNADKLAEIIANGIKNARKEEWSLVATVDLNSKEEKEDTVQDIRISGSLFIPGKYKFKLLLKDYNKNILNIFENTINLNEKALLFKSSLFGVWYFYTSYKFLNFIKRYNYDKVIFIQDRNLKNFNSSSRNIKIENIRLNDMVLFSYETTGENSNIQDYIVHNKDIYIDQYFRHVFFKYSTLEIYKKNDD